MRFQPTFNLQRIRRSLRLGHVDDPVHVERHLLARSRPMFVAETVDVFPVHAGRERMVARRDRPLVGLIVAGRILDLTVGERIDQQLPRGRAKWESVEGRGGMRVKCTQKSTSRFPLPPNSRSPTWKLTVILSSACNCSWKHSRECAPSWMLCATEAPRSAAKAMI